MRPDSELFRKVMGHFVTGVTVVTALDGDQPQGITVNALSSVSLDPPLVMVALDRRRFITPTVRARAASRSTSSARASRRCPTASPAPRPRRTATRSAAPPGRPVKPACRCSNGAIATLECTIVGTFSAGDHDLFIARVDAVANPEHHPLPLLYYRRQYLRIEQAEATELEGRPEV